MLYRDLMRALPLCLSAAALLALAAPASTQTTLPDSAAEALDRLLGEPRGSVGMEAEPQAPSPVPPAAMPGPTSIDTLFERLRKEASPERAERIASEIQARWAGGDGATIELLMGWASAAVAGRDPGAAFDLYEQVMLLEPDYAEAYNARATLNFQLDQYGRSLADIEQTLAREPRHFGALLGLGAILEEMGRDEAALYAYRRVLAVYPALRPAQEAATRLTAKVRGRSL